MGATLALVFKQPPKTTDQEHVGAQGSLFRLILLQLTDARALRYQTAWLLTSRYCSMSDLLGAFLSLLGPKNTNPASATQLSNYMGALRQVYQLCRRDHESLALAGRFFQE